MTDSKPSSSSTALPDWLLGDTRPRWRRPSTWIAIAVVLLLAALLWWWRADRASQAGPQYVTEPVTRGKLSLSVMATGTLQPTRSVSIGSELSGTVTEVLVDVNDRVSKGQVLVRLDTAKLIDQVTKSRAALDGTLATLAQTQATLNQARVALNRLEEVHKLSGGQLPAATDLDTARATQQKAVADEHAAQTNVTQARAALSTDETNLQKASIRSPTDGVILTRAVEPGNAVAASLQAVTLFTMAPDLSRLLLSVNVDEADVGQVKEGQSASFTVSAWPGRQYPAKVTRVAYGSTITDNVVTYTTQLQVDNPDLTLRPGMTATATIAANEHANVLLVPGTALTFSPDSAAAGAGPAPSGQGDQGGGLVSKLMPRPPMMGGKRSASAAGAGKGANGTQRQIWVLQDGKPQAFTVTVGLSDGRRTEVAGPGLREGMAVITEQRSGAARP